jgi:hypothetical protein
MAETENTEENENVEAPEAVEEVEAESAAEGEPPVVPSAVETTGEASSGEDEAARA